jgi:hypothetical protein
MTTIDKRGALHDRSGKYAGNTRGGVRGDVKPKTAAEWKQALFSDYSPPDTSSVKNPEATAAAKQALFLAPIPRNSSEGNTVKLKNVLKGIGIGAAIIGVAAGCAGGNAAEGTTGNETPPAPTTATIEATPDTEATKTSTEVTPASETPSGPAMGTDVAAGQIESLRASGAQVWERMDGSGVVVDSTQRLPQAVIDDMTGHVWGAMSGGAIHADAQMSLNDTTGLTVIAKRDMSGNKWYSVSFAGGASMIDPSLNPEYYSQGRCVDEVLTFKASKDDVISTERTDVTHKEALAVATQCGKKFGLEVYDISGG